MRRQDIRLVALARQGDTHARCELGRRYLLGSEGFTRHVRMGIEYLTHESVRGTAPAVRLLAETLPLQELVRHGLLEALEIAARSGVVAAQVKLATWLLVASEQEASARQWLRSAADAGHDGAGHALAAMQGEPASQLGALALLRRRSDDAEMDAADVIELAVRHALEAAAPARAMRGLHLGERLLGRMPDEWRGWLVQVLVLAEATGTDVVPPSVPAVEDALESRARTGDARAAHLLGRALSGIDCGPLPALRLAAGTNVRRGAALLLRAADAGVDDAWLHLYRLHADHRLSVANAQMARFFLEKSASRGHADSQRRLGALMLRASGSLHETEQAIAWLHRAAEQGDPSARDLLSSLVLPLTGSEAEAQAAIQLVRREDPWLSIRMELSREFGLTKLEALCVDPLAGARPWGLVVGKNPFITQSRRAAARAVPARRPQSQETLQRAALMFSPSGPDGQPEEGNFRRRSDQQRRLFARFAIAEGMFFSQATSTVLETLRQGPKWALRARAGLQLALAT